MANPQIPLSTLINAQSADETVGQVDCMGAVVNLRFDVIGTGTTSSGVIHLECAPTMGYTGTWSPITTVNASDVTGGAVKSVFATGCFNAVRARISTVIGGGGTVTVMVAAN